MNKTVQFNGDVFNIESNINKVQEITENSNTTQYPSAKAVKDALKRYLPLDAESEIIFDGGDASGEVDIGFAIEDVISSESANPVTSKAIKKHIDEIFAKALSDAHPVGSYYWSSDPTDPSELFGGSWEQIVGKFVIAAGTYKDKNDVERTFEVGEVDGEYLHKLEIDEMPSHNHDVYMYCNYGGGSQTVSGKFIIESNDFVSWSAGERTNINTGFLNTTNLSGNNISHNNMPPYIVAYCWKRIS